jgi:hypothetical protein
MKQAANLVTREYYRSQPAANTIAPLAPPCHSMK